MYIFLDTEFIRLPDGKAMLLSIGLCGPNSEEFYGEHDVDVHADADSFVAAEVLPQLGHGVGIRGSLPEVGAALALWLRQFKGDRLEICYDYHYDREALEELLRVAPSTAPTSFEPVHLGYLLQDTDGVQAAEQCWNDLAHRRGIKRHHGLADALALRARFQAVHPDPPDARAKTKKLDQLAGILTRADQPSISLKEMKR